MRPGFPLQFRSSARTVALVGALAVVGFGSSILLHARQAPTDTLLLTNTRILDTRAGRYLPAGSVLVQGGKVASINPVATPPPVATATLDLKGAVLVPGLGDLAAQPAPSTRADTDFHYLLSLAYGVTMMRAAGVPERWGITQRASAGRLDLLAPRLWIAGPILDQASIGFGVRHVPDTVAARRAVEAQAAAKVDWVAVGPGTSPEVVRAIVAAAKAARLPVSARPGDSSMLDLGRAGITLIVGLGVPGKRVTEQGAGESSWAALAPAEARSAGQALAKMRVTVVPLLASAAAGLTEAEAKDDPALALLPPAWKEEIARGLRADDRSATALAARGRLVAALNAAGVRLATGVDPTGRGYPIPGAGIHRELALMVGAGLTPAEAIRAATSNCARVLGAANAGEIRAGAPADFFAVDGDPLRQIGDLRKIRIVVRGGEVLDPKELMAQAKRAVR